MGGTAIAGATGEVTAGGSGAACAAGGFGRVAGGTTTAADAKGENPVAVLLPAVADGLWIGAGGGTVTSVWGRFAEGFAGSSAMSPLTFKLLGRGRGIGGTGWIREAGTEAISGFFSGVTSAGTFSTGLLSSATAPGTICCSTLGALLWTCFVT